MNLAAKDVKIRLKLWKPKEPNINFISKRVIAFGLSLLVIAGGLVSFFMQGEEKYGIDFTGGMLEQVRFQQAIDIGSVRAALRDKGLLDAQISGLQLNHVAAQ